MILFYNIVKALIIAYNMFKSGFNGFPLIIIYIYIYYNCVKICSIVKDQLVPLSVWDACPDANLFSVLLEFVRPKAPVAQDGLTRWAQEDGPRERSVRGAVHCGDSSGAVHTSVVNSKREEEDEDRSCLFCPI